MQRRRTARFSHGRTLVGSLRTQLKMAAMAASAAVPLLMLSLLLPRPLVLPTVCLLTVAAATFIATIAWWRDVDHSAARVTAWDIAGALALIGFAAGMLSSPEQILQIAETTTPLSRIE